MSDTGAELPEHQDHDTTEPITVSVVFQMSPLWLTGRPGVAYRGDLAHFAEGLCHWVAKPVAGFADMRGGDAFVAVTLTQGDRSASHQYRDGHYHEMKPKAGAGQDAAQPPGDGPAAGV